MTAATGDDLVMIYASWDSGPYAIYGRSQETAERTDRPGGYGDHTVLVPREVIERYEHAQLEHAAAEDAVSEAVKTALKRLVPDDAD